MNKLKTLILAGIITVSGAANALLSNEKGLWCTDVNIRTLSGDEETNEASEDFAATLTFDTDGDISFRADIESLDQDSIDIIGSYERSYEFFGPQLLRVELNRRTGELYWFNSYQGHLEIGTATCRTARRLF